MHGMRHTLRTIVILRARGKKKTLALSAGVPVLQGRRAGCTGQECVLGSHDHASPPASHAAAADELARHTSASNAPAPIYCPKPAPPPPIHPYSLPWDTSRPCSHVEQARVGPFPPLQPREQSQQPKPFFICKRQPEQRQHGGRSRTCLQP